MPVKSLKKHILVVVGVVVVVVVVGVVVVVVVVGVVVVVVVGVVVVVVAEVANDPIKLPLVVEKKSKQSEKSHDFDEILAKPCKKSFCFGWTEEKRPCPFKRGSTTIPGSVKNVQPWPNG